MTAESERSNRSGIAPGVWASLLRLFAGFGQATTYFSSPFLRLRPPASAENPAEVPEAEDASTESSEAKPAAAQVCAIAPAVDVNVDPLCISDFSHTVLDAQEIERRRSLVRTLFNEFWNEAHDRPPTFVERFDQAEDYLNERLAAHGELWRLDANSRALLGLPAQSKPARRIQ